MLRIPVTRLLAGLCLSGLTGAAAADATLAEGERVFASVCQACHQAGGVGAPGLAPPLAGTLTGALASEPGRKYLALVLIHGLSGPIRSQGQLYTGAMPVQADLGDAQLAAVATYVAQTLNGLADVSFTVDDLALARTEQVTHKALRQLREKLVPP